MKRRTWLVAFGTGALALVGFLVFSTEERAGLRRQAVHAESPVEARSTPEELRLAAQLAERDRLVLQQRRRITELEAKVARREAESGETGTSESSTPESSVALRIAPGLAEALAWLARLDPETFGELTPEEAASLAELELRGAGVRDEDLALLAAFPGLTSVSLRGKQITDDGLVPLDGIESLRHVDLRATGVSGAGLSWLPTQELEALHLTDTRVTGDDLYHLPPMSRLETLKLNRLDFGDEHVGALGPYPSLRHLELDGTAITDDGLRHLFALLPQLARVELRHTAVTEAALRELHAYFPACELVVEPSGVTSGAF